jgi:hypothetical protein
VSRRSSGDRIGFTRQRTHSDPLDNDRDESERGDIVSGQAVVSCCQASPVLETAEEAFDKVATPSRLFLETFDRVGGALGLRVAPFASAMSFGGLKQVADLYHESCARFGNPSGRLMCSYFTHFADNKSQQDAARARQIRYYKECVIPALPGHPKT